MPGRDTYAFVLSRYGASVRPKTWTRISLCRADSFPCGGGALVNSRDIGAAIRGVRRGALNRISQFPVGIHDFASALVCQSDQRPCRACSGIEQRGIVLGRGKRI